MNFVRSHEWVKLTHPWTTMEKIALDIRRLIYAVNTSSNFGLRSSLFL